MNTSNAQTVGELREAIASMGTRGWSVAPRLRDDDELPRYALGADLSEHPRAADAAPIDRRALLQRAVANPLLRARNRQLQTLDLTIVFTFGVDWRDRWGGYWLTTVQNQNPCNNCWAFAASALVETMVRIEHGFWAKRSEGDLRDGWGGPSGENWVVRDGPNATPCAHGAGVGGALDWVTANGLADPDCYAWSGMDKTYAPTADRNGRTVRIGTAVNVGDVAATKHWIDAVGPVIASFDVYNDFFAYAGPEVYHRSPKATLQGNHIALVVGYDNLRECWIIRNSYGSGWGIAGYGLIGYGECNIDVYAKFGLVDTNPDPWTKRRLHAGNVFESGNGPHHCNLELLRGTSPHVMHLWRADGGGGYAWHRAGELQSDNDAGAGAACIGQPACTATTYNRNFEAVYWEGSGRLRHWWMDQTVNAWHDGGRFGPADVEGYPGFLQSNYGAPGNLEVVVRRRGGRLQHWWRDGAAPFAWHDGGTIADGVRMSGPSFVQANVGTRGHFYVVCVTAFGTLQLWWRDNDGGHAWVAGEVFAASVGETPVCMIQGQWGTTNELGVGNFELCVAVGGRVQHWWRDNGALRSEPPRADNANPRYSDSAHLAVPAASYRAATRSRLETHAEVPVRADVASLLDDALSSTAAEPALAALGNVAIARSPPARWHRSAVFGHDVKHVWGLLQSSRGFDLEVVVERHDGFLQHYLRDGNGWQEGPVIDP
jgi:hypothetical protein